MRDSYKAETIAWLRKVLDETGLTPSELARKAKVASTTLTRPLNDPNHPHAVGGRTLSKIARATGSELPPHLRGDADDSPPPAPHTMQIPEYGVRASAGFGALNEHEEVIGYWPFSREALHALRLRGTRLAIVEVAGDSMSPTLLSGDRVILDLDDVKPPGLFVIVDGDTLIAKRIERLPGPPGQKQRLRITSDNKLHNDHEVEADWVKIVGRVASLIRRL